MIVALEGTDQAGKGTQATLLARALRRRGTACSLLSLPDYATPVGRVLRSILASRREVRPQVIHALMSANRWEALPRIERALAAGRLVIMDRYYHSNVAYGAANGLRRAWLESLDAGMPRSDIVVLLDSRGAESFRRKPSGRDRFERDAEFLRRVSREYRRMARRGRWHVIDASLPREGIHAQVLGIVTRGLRA